MADNKVFISGPEVQERYGISAMTLHRWRKDQHMDFPNPMKIKTRNFFRLSDLEKWERSRIKQTA